MPTIIASVAQRLCDRYGGRAALVPATGGVRILDCPLWPAHATAWLRVELPDALLAIEPCASSLSGFAIAIARPPPPLHRWPRILLALGSLAFVWAVACILQPHQTDHADEDWYARLAQNCRWMSSN